MRTAKRSILCIVAAYLSTNYVIQKAWTQKLEARTGGDATKFMADTADGRRLLRPLSQILR